VTVIVGVVVYLACGVVFARTVERNPTFAVWAALLWFPLCLAGLIMQAIELIGDWIDHLSDYRAGGYVSKVIYLLGRLILAGKERE
jgi:hypothetical protein